MSHDRRQTDRQARGFTLIELLLAMGLFTVSIAMVAALFPAAIFQAKAADEYTMATIISQNAVATIKSRVSRMSLNGAAGSRASPVVDTFTELVLGTTGTFDLHADDAKYQHSPSVRDLGWVALVRQVPGGADYQFAVVPYVVAKGQPVPTLMEVKLPQVKIDGELFLAEFPDGVPVPVGSPVILRDGQPGRYAFIIGTLEDPADPNNPNKPKALLSNDLGFAATENDVWVRICVDPNAEKSPAIGCFTFRTALRP